MQEASFRPPPQDASAYVAQLSKTPASTSRFSVAPQPCSGNDASSASSSARILAPWPAAASVRISSTNASESVLRWVVRPLVRLRTYANRPLASGMKDMKLPRTLSAPPAPAWPARTEARAVLEVLLATAVLLGKRIGCRRRKTPREVENTGA